MRARMSPVKRQFNADAPGRLRPAEALRCPPHQTEATMPVLEQTYPDVRNYIGGSFVETSDRRMLDITNPADGSVISRVPLSGNTEMDRAVAAAQKAFPAWSATPI